MPTKIQWTDETWNFVRGCRRVSPGCENCYAERMAHRFSGPGQKYEGLTVLKSGRPTWNGKWRLNVEDLAKPLRWRKPRMIFVESMSDLFYEEIPDDVIAAAFGVMAACPQHTFQILTKRAARMREWFAWLARDSSLTDPHAAPPAVICGIHAANLGVDVDYFGLTGGWPLPNVWLMTSAEDQPRAVERIGHLLACPAAVVGVSYEPALGPIDFTDLEIFAASADGHSPRLSLDALRGHVRGPDDMLDARINWVIYGSESGPGARPDDPAWARSMVEQCRTAGVAAFVKQLVVGGKLHKNLDELPEDLRVREWPR